MLSSRSHGVSRSAAVPLTLSPVPLGDIEPTQRVGSAQCAADGLSPGGELGLLAGLVRAGELMDDASDLAELWKVVAIEAARTLGTGARTMEWTGQHWVLLADSGGLGRGTTAPMTDPRRSGRDYPIGQSTELPIELDLVGTRSVLVTIMECTVLPAPTRLVWTSAEENAFVRSAELAGLYTRFAAGAVRRLHTRTHLQRAVAARNRIGQAQGILMARHQLSAVEAFDALNRRSQNTNVKLRAVADEVIRTGDLVGSIRARPVRRVAQGRGQV